MFPTQQQVYEWLKDVKDPEVPVLSILDLGIVREVQVDAAGKITIKITPTYSGCPAMDVIAMNIRLALSGRNHTGLNIEMQLSPAWTTDWMSEDAKSRLEAYGIAAPRRLAGTQDLFEEEGSVPCPKCHSLDTRLVSQHGATACKALYQCNSCQEPFEYFKCH